MSTLTASNWSLIAFCIGVVFLCVFMLTVPQLLGGRTKGRAKHEAFESGVVSVGSARMRLSAKFYLVAMFFVIFDVEALYLYAWSTAVRESGWAGYIEVLVFILVLLAGLVYVWRIGALDWAPEGRIIAANKARAAVDGSPIDGQLDLAEVTRFIPMEILELDPTGKVPAQLSGKVNDPRASRQAKGKLNAAPESQS